MKTQTKTEIRNNTAKATKLLRGIDNEAASIAKAQDALNKRVATVKKTAAQVTSLLAGISNTALAAPMSAPKPVAKKAVKPAKKVVKAKAAKVAKKPVAKKVAKPAMKAKPAAKKVAKPVAAKAPKLTKAGERPPLISLMNAILDKTPGVTAAAINTALVSQGFKFSRQSQYNQLKKTELYARTGEGAAATFKRASSSNSTKTAPAKAATKTSDEEAEAFVEKSSTNPVTVAAT